MITQGQESKVFFFLTSSPAAPAGLPGQTFSGSEIVVIKPNASTAAAANIATVVDKGGGWYLLTLTAGETGIGLAAGETGELGLEINKTGALPNRALGYEVSSVAPGALTSAERSSTAGVVATAVGALAVEGSRTLVQLLRLLSARLINKAQVPMSAAGGTISGRDAADTKNRLVGSVSSTGAITWTTLDGD